MANTAGSFSIPADLLKTFKADVRVLPHVLPTNGWIVFDREMLISVLRDNNAAVRTELANQIARFGESGGELVMMGK